MTRTGEPLAVGDLSAVDLHATTVRRDGGLILVVEDGDVRILIDAESGDAERAARGCERLAAAALGHAELLRKRARSGADR